MVAIPGTAMAHHWAQAPTLPVNEVFGPTIQGEGPHTGRRCWFVRLGDCNLHCSWCDTKRTWDRSQYDLAAENPPATIDEVHLRLHNAGARTGNMVVLTGGEPLIHDQLLARMFDHRTNAYPWLRWHIESNGTIRPPEWAWWDVVEHITLSPKIGDQGDPEKRRLKPRALAEWADLTRASQGAQVAWKFVVTSIYELTAVRRLVDQYGIDGTRVWIMPEGTDIPTILEGQRALATAVVAEGWNLSTRLHVLTGAR